MTKTLALVVLTISLDGYEVYARECYKSLDLIVAKPSTLADDKWSMAFG